MYILHAGDRFVRRRRRVQNILELLYGGDHLRMPDISGETIQQAYAGKKNFWKNIWNEELMMEKKDYTVTYTEDAIRMMDERMILKSDVERVLADYREKSGSSPWWRNKRTGSKKSTWKCNILGAFYGNRRRVSGTQSIQSSNEVLWKRVGTIMAVERNYYTIDPEGKLTCNKMQRFHW